MSNRRVKAVGYEDDYDEYEEEEEYEDGEDGRTANELSAEDQELMLLNTVKVKSLLGEDFIATDQEIQDALWHYFYDVEKSVTYLKNLKRPFTTPKKSKENPVSRFDQATHAAEANIKHTEGKSNTSTAKSKNGTVVNGVTKDVAGMSVKDSSTSKHKNLNVVEEFKKANMKAAASFVVVGHVDHGKSTLMGRLLYDLKVVDEASMERLRRESKKIGKSSFALAWVMDATTDERERGVTVDIATNHFETEKTRFTILDAPGHQDFIPNMIAGASQADFAVLVIDASTNSFESGLRGQTREHAMLVRSMGVQRLIVAVNKMDMCDWSHDRFTEIQQQMSRFLEIAGFASSSISFIPCAGLTGDNITKPVTDIQNAAWYTGPTLVSELDNAEPTKRALDKPLRMTISEVFRTSPNNPISVSGKLDAGSLQAGDTVTIMPSSERAIVKSLTADNYPADWAVAGQIAVLNLADIDPIHLKHGDIICHPSTAIKNIKSFTAKILAIDHVMPMFVEVHRGPLHVAGKISGLVATLDKASGNVVRKKPKVIQPGAVARVIVELEREMPLEAPSKVILRSEGRTVAAGLVEE
ncbi:hypothetical protein EJ08DRAFT_646609 [Tothia fuscella]|uniref:Elongation factor 1 alpha-like protein n=1 Tax=Tothia fuscella TaxID=1048955 RepID=A0A9P4NZU8_9PEZI|nr:hypothetical protein EJ08DRAFT_646609 [Tothia fuscella]